MKELLYAIALEATYQDHCTLLDEWPTRREYIMEACSWMGSMPGPVARALIATQTTDCCGATRTVAPEDGDHGTTHFYVCGECGEAT